MDTQQPLPTSAHTNGSLSKYDETDRVRQRMDGLRKHHNESADIYNRTQPIIDEQIHEETKKYLKNGQVSGTKTKGQKPRAPKRQRNPPKTQQITLYPPRIPQTQQQQQQPQSMHVQQPNPQHQMQPQPQPQQQQQQQQLLLQTPPQQLQTPSQQHQMQQHHQHQIPPQQQQHFKYQATNMYQHSTMQNQHPYHRQQAPHPYHGQPQTQQTYHGHQQPQQIYQQQIQPTTTHLHFAQHPSHHSGTLNTHQHKYMLPNDLDLNLQAGLECDVDSLIKHEMSVEGQLDFNHDLLLKLDNHFELG